MSIVPMRRRSRAPVSIWSAKATPKMTIGTVATMRYQPIRASSSDRSVGSRSDRTHVVVIRQRSSRK